MHHWVTVFIACVTAFVYGHAHFVRVAWPVAHPWSGLAMVMFGVTISVVPLPPDGRSPTRRRLALFLAVAASAFWLISELQTAK